MVGRIVDTWTDRQEDILFVGIGTPTFLAVKRAALSFGSETQVIAGIQKCVQRFLSLLLTRVGTAVRSELGCGLLSALSSGMTRSEGDLRNLFSVSVAAVAPQVNRQAVLPDERIASVVLTAVSVEQSRIGMRMLLTTEAGSTADFLAPIAR